MAGTAGRSGDEIHGDDGRRHPEITPRWLRQALLAGRSAFEREMKRDRRDIDRKFDRYWKESGDREF